MIQTTPPKVAAVHDLSGFGRCSLSVIIPVLSSMGVQVCPVPTAVLSTHTGGFENYSFVDLTDHLTQYLNHWCELDIDFDCFYSGFFGSVKQMDIMADYIQRLKKKGTLIVIDPVFADEGELYSTFTNDIISNMKNYISFADIITPNMTEACFLLDEEFKPCYSASELRSMLKRLTDMGPGIAVITSVSLDDGNCGVVAYDKMNDRYWNVWCEYMPAEYPGTGDIFCSVMIGALLSGDSLPMALDRAVGFVSLAIKTTFGYTGPLRDGVFIEKILHTLSESPSSFNYSVF